MNKRITVILGHPDSETFCGALAGAYMEGAKASGADVAFVALGELEFDPILSKGYRGHQTLEPDLERAQRAVTECDHLVIVTPTWWASMPAVLKGFFDRVFLPGYAFKYRENSSMWDRLLTGRSARLIVTMDAPGWYNFLVYRNSVQNSIKHGILRFCGFKPVGVTTISGVKAMSDEKRSAAIGKVRGLGKEQK